MKKCFIIAEAGVNHNGNMDMALNLIEKAAECGADAVKFQSFNAALLVSPNAPSAEYQKKNLSQDISQFDMIKKLELKEKQHQQLAAHCRKNKIMFLSSPFDLESIDMLCRLGLKVFKIPSGEITNVPYLRKIGALNNEIILSTGMATMDEVSFALKLLQQSGTSSGNITLLHCHTEYPTPFDHVNLRAMVSMKERFPVKIGYSDHTPGIEVPIAAVALGAVVIEKHFTLDKNLPGPDHKASLNTEELRAMILAIRNIELALGNGEKIPSAAELRNALVVRKSIFSCKNISKGTLINASHICMMRPGDGISPLYFDQIIGKKVKNDIECGKKLKWEDLE